METIGVFFGSRSPEHDVSIITGELIISGLRSLGYRVVPVYLDKKGTWFLGEKLGAIGFFQQRERNFSGVRGYTLDLAQTGTLVFRPRSVFRKPVVIDIAFPAFHGRNGEDGTIQGLFELLDVPYVGCDVVSSALSMDKVLTKLLYQQYGLPTTAFVYFQKQDWERDRSAVMKRITDSLRWPVFVKPARLGSSIGIARAENEKDCAFAIDVALHYDEKVIVENGVAQCLDLTCAVLGLDDPLPSLVQETAFDRGFLSYEDKYLKGGGTQTGKAQQSIVIPARIDAEASERIREYARRVFSLFGCSGIARVDFLYDLQSRQIFVNEINTLPGTLYHHLWKASGIELPDLLSRLLGYARERHTKNRVITSTFESDILRESNWSGKLKFLKEQNQP